MITTQIDVCAVPAVVWEQNVLWNDQTIAICSFVKDALGIEQRIARMVNQDNERARYTLCCARLEAALKRLPLMPSVDEATFGLALSAFHMPTVTLNAEYLDVIDLMYHKSASHSADMRLGATFFPPEMVESHISAFLALAGMVNVSECQAVQRRVAFFRLARQHHCGVVEFVNPYQFEDREKTVESSVNVVNVMPLASVPSIEISLDEEVFDNEGRNAYEILRAQVESALRLVENGQLGMVNFSNQPHNVITEVLNEFVYAESGKLEKPRLIQVVYTDGSQGKPFPLRCLPQRDEAELAQLATVRPLRIALLSMRHLAMDHDVDMAWFRNREVSKARAFAETDGFCYAQTQKQLQQSRAEGDLKLHIYQTGLQPAVIGFYRGLVEELIHRADHPASLEVIPYYYRGKAGYRQGRRWC